MSTCELSKLGWKPCFEQQLPPEDDSPLVVARVSAHFGSQLLLLGEEGEFRIPIQLADSCGDIAVGDWLVLDGEDHRVLQRLERQTLLYRKAAGEEVKPQMIAANIDTLFIVCSCNEDFNLSRIERYLALAFQAGATPVVVLTKADLSEDAAELRQQTERLHPGLLVETIDARQPSEVEVLLPWCGPGQTVALLGSSGVGKSTMANALGARGWDSGDLATGEIREHDGKGRHTTTWRSLHLLPSGGVLVDNPGMRELQLPACEEGITDLFEDILVIAQDCRFNNCNHEGDAGCAVEAAIDTGELDERRYHSFMKLSREQERNSQSLAERREKDRERGKMYKSIIGAKKKQRGDHH